jgi:hypothetical protein
MFRVHISICFLVFSGVLSRAGATSISGTVVDTAGNPLPAVSVSLIKHGVYTLTDEHGKFDLPVDDITTIAPQPRQQQNRYAVILNDTHRKPI